MNLGFAGDRDVAVSVLAFLIEQGVRPRVLLVPELARASHADQLLALCPHLQRGQVLEGREFARPEGVAELRSLALDIIVGVHFPYVVPRNVLELCRIGFLNLHPAFLPYNRGWHTPSWAILEGTPAGATLHFMSEGVDAGDIIHQKVLEVSPGDTAHTLYQKLKSLELEVFKEAWPSLSSGSFRRLPQSASDGTCHKRSELLSDCIRRIDLDAPTTARELIRRLRALTTNRIDEAAYYVVGGRCYCLQVTIKEEAPGPSEQAGGRIPS